jgi:DNA-binding transcriptional ArsR family regulator
LTARTLGPSPLIDGWLATSGVPGLRRWLAGEAGLVGAAGDRFQVLRTQIYDLLEERGWIVKGTGHNVPIHIAPAGVGDHAEPASEFITVSPHGAGYGDPGTNLEVERAAMLLVAEDYAARGGWIVTDVSMQKVGWDLTVTSDDGLEHLEVKGVSGSKPTVLLTKNEYASATSDPHWRLLVVTQALTAPRMTPFEAQEVVASCRPHVYRVQLGH